MFPIRDHNPSLRTPYVTYALLATNILVYLTYGFETNGRVLAQIYTTWGAIPREIANGSGMQGVFTSMFMHGGWMHLIGNMLFLWIFGDNMEDQLGHGKFLVFYLFGGVCATLAHVAVNANSGVPLVGASGAIAAVMGGYLLLFPKAKVDILLIIVIIFKVFPIPAWVMLGLWFVFQVFNGAAAGADSGVAYWAHAGGFVVGIGLMLPWWLRRGGMAFWDRVHMHPPNPEAQYSLSRIPNTKRRR